MFPGYRPKNGPLDLIEDAFRTHYGENPNSPKAAVLPADFLAEDPASGYGC